MTTILAGCVIHNICILSNDEFVAALADAEDDIPQPQPNRLNFSANAQVTGLQKRLDIVVCILAFVFPCRAISEHVQRLNQTFVYFHSLKIAHM